jgi:hypothetical protein
MQSVTDGVGKRFRRVWQPRNDRRGVTAASAAGILTSFKKGWNVRTSSLIPAPLRARRQQLAGGLAASALLLGTSFLLGGSTAAASSSPSPRAGTARTAAIPPVVTLTGSIPALAGDPATLFAEVQLPLDRNAQGFPRRLEDETVASESITSSEFSLPVPDSPTLDRAEESGKGIVNFEIIVLSGTRTTAWGLSVPITATPSTLNLSQASTEIAHVVQVPAFPALHVDQRANPDAVTTPGGVSPPECSWTEYGGQTDKTTRIGEVHVASATGVADTFEFRTENDQTISWGVTATGPTSGWLVGGTESLTNSLRAGGGQTFGPGTVSYVTTTGYYQEYRGIGVSGGCDGFDDAFRTDEVGTSDVVDSGSGKPARSPYKGGCVNDPLKTPLQKNSTWYYDDGLAKTYGDAATAFGFSFSDSDGFTMDVEHSYSTTSNSPTTWLCGVPGDQPTDTPVLYNTTG